MARLAERLASNREVRRSLTRGVPVLLVIALAAAAFLYFRYHERLTPEESISRYLELIPRYEQDFAVALSNGLDPSDVEVVGRILSRLDKAKAKIRSFSPTEGLESLAQEHARAAVALEVEIMKAVRQGLSAGMREIAWVEGKYGEELVPEKIKDYYGEVRKNYELLRAFGGGRHAAEAKSLLKSLAYHYRFAAILLAYRHEVETLLGEGITRAREVERAKRILDKLVNLRTRFLRTGEEIKPNRRQAITALIEDVIDQIEQVKRNTRERVKRVFAAYPHENNLEILYEYREELPELRSMLHSLGASDEAREIEPALESLETRIGEYEEIESAEQALAAIRDQMVAFKQELSVMLADGLQPRDAKKCVEMQAILEENFVVFRQGERESFKQAHPNILLMLSLHNDITTEIANRTSRMSQDIMSIRQGYSMTKDIGLLSEQVSRVKNYLRVFKAAARRNEVSQATAAIKELNNRIDFLKHYDKRMAILEVKIAEIESLRLEINSIFGDGLTVSEVPKVRKIRRGLDRYKKYDPWVEGGVFRERVELVDHIDRLVESVVNNIATRVRAIGGAFYRSSNEKVLESQQEEVRNATELFGALRRDDLEQEAKSLSRQMEYYKDAVSLLQDWEREFTRLRDDPFDPIGRPIRGLQAGDIKKLLKIVESIHDKRREAEDRLSKEGAHEEMLSAVKAEFLKMSTKINQAIDDRMNEAEARVREISTSLPAIGSVAALKERIDELEEAFDLLRLKRESAAVSAKAAISQARKRIDELEAIRDRR